VFLSVFDVFGVFDASVFDAFDVRDVFAVFDEIVSGAFDDCV